METILISACLLGEKTRWDGKSNYDERIKKIRDVYDVVPVCPEVLGGLPIPRIPSEILNTIVYNKNGKDVSTNFTDGAFKVLNVVHYLHIKKAILVENSPSCGVHQVYNGRFEKKLVDGEGVTTRFLRNAGVTCYTLDEFLLELEENEKKALKETEVKTKGPYVDPEYLNHE